MISLLKKTVLGKVLDVSSESGIDQTLIVNLEAALLEKVEETRRFAQKDQVALSYAAMDLNLVKAAFFARIFSETNPQFVFDFEIEMRNIPVINSFIGGVNLYLFEREMDLLHKKIAPA